MSLEVAGCCLCADQRWLGVGWCVADTRRRPPSAESHCFYIGLETLWRPLQPALPRALPLRREASPTAAARGAPRRGAPKTSVAAAMGLAPRQDWKSFLRRASTGRSHTATGVEGGGNARLPLASASAPLAASTRSRGTHWDGRGGERRFRVRLPPSSVHAARVGRAQTSRAMHHDQGSPPLGEGPTWPVIDVPTPIIGTIPLCAGTVPSRPPRYTPTPLCSPAGRPGGRGRRGEEAWRAREPNRRVRAGRGRSERRSGRGHGCQPNAANPAVRS